MRAGDSCTSSAFDTENKTCLMTGLKYMLPPSGDIGLQLDSLDFMGKSESTTIRNMACFTA